MSLVKIAAFPVILLILLFACGQASPKETKKSSPEPQVQHLGCGQDSLQITVCVHWLVKDTALCRRMLLFYQSRKYAPAWINAAGLNENAGNLINFLYNEKAYSFAKAGSLPDELQDLRQRVLSDTSGHMYCEDSLALRLEVLLTKSFFEFATRNWAGAGDEILKQVHWYIARKKLDYGQLLDNYLHSGKAPLTDEPVYRQYGLLKRYLRKYSELGAKNKWPSLSTGNITLKLGDTSEIITGVKQLLVLTGDMVHTDSVAIFDTLLESAVKIFQRRHGLKADGVVSRRTLQAMRVTPQERVRQILLNMERCRWVPVQVSGDYLVVNIPEFRLHVYSNERQQWSCKVIVGKSDPLLHTVIFNDSVEWIVINPYWNIPKNILRKETLPAIKKNAHYISTNNLEVIDRSGHVIDPSGISWNSYTNNFPYLIRQRPGEDNALGTLKFLFPNPYDIYMHDTPSKKLFDETDRDFSHGCIRVEQPMRLAEFLLKEDDTWNTDRILETISEEREVFVKLKKKTPVFIAYFTCWVDRSGRLNFRDDLYGHDARLQKLLFVN